MSYLNHSTTSSRVAYAKKCLLSGMRDFTRAFDDCFENGDGAKVFALLLDDAERNDQLMIRMRRVWSNLHDEAARNKYVGMSRQEIYKAL